MANKRLIRTISTILLVATVLSGCSGKKKNNDGQKAVTGPTAESVTSSETSGTPTPPPTPKPTDTPTPTPTPKIENISNNEEGHYTFQRHVFGSAYLEEFGEKYRDAMYSFCDAVYNGEDTFDCPDEDMYGWCIGRFSMFFCPLASAYVAKYSPEGGPSYKDGKGYIYYTIPKDEFMKKEKEFEEQIVRIINDCVSDDYTDFEKALALYEYMCTNYTYDYDMYEHMNERTDDQTGYRCLVEKHGICCEVAALYNFLLLQVGVDSEEMGGFGTSEGHSWVYVTIDGKSYHIDATWGQTCDKVRLDYFMMTDKIREDRDDFKTTSLSIGAQGDQSRKYHEFSSTDEKYLPLWDKLYVGMDRETQEIVYEDYDGNIGRFYYGSDAADEGQKETSQKTELAA